MRVTSALKPTLLKKAMLKATFIGALGALMLLLGGTLLPVALLQVWGIPLFIVGMGLIICGLLPYKQLSKLEGAPYAVVLNEQAFLFGRGNTPFFELHYQDIDTLFYLEKEDVYGIGVRLKRPKMGRVKVLVKKRVFAPFLARFLVKFNEIDLFLPYFSKRSFEEIQEVICGTDTQA